MELLKVLIQSNGFVTIEELSKMFSVGQRSIRDDLAGVSEYLDSTNIVLLRDRKLGVAVKKDSVSESELNSLLEKIKAQSDYYSDSDRFNIILRILLLGNDRCTIASLAEAAKTGRTTAIKDLDRCEAWLKERKIYIRRLPRKGIELDFDEYHYRRACLSHISKFLKEFDFQKLYNSFRKSEFLVFNLWANEFIDYFTDSVNLNLVKNFIRKYEKEQDIRFTDEGFVNVFFYIVIALKRNQLGFFLKEKDFTHDILTQMPNLSEWIDDNNRFLSGSNGVSLSDTEMKTILWHMLAQNKRYISANPINNISNERYLVRRFIEIVGDFLATDLTGDESLFANLLMHITPTVHRLIFGIEVENPLKHEIKRLYPEVFKACCAGGRFFLQELGKMPNDDEISYLTMHIAASVEKTRREKTKLNFFKAIIVCSSGIATSNMLHVRLLSEFPNLLIENVSSIDELPSCLTDDVDLIISTAPLSSGIKKPVICVSPLLTEDDSEKIKKFMRKSFIRSNNNATSSIVSDIMSIISSECTIVDYPRLNERIEQYFSKSEDSHNLSLPLLSELASDDLIALDVLARDSREAVQKAGELLYLAGVVKFSYIKAMQISGELMGQNLVIAPGVALPHAKPQDGVNKLGMAFVRLSHPVVFGNPEYDPVSFVFALGAEQSTVHLAALSELVELTEDPHAMKALQKASTTDEFRRVLREFEKKLSK